MLRPSIRHHAVTFLQKTSLNKLSHRLYYNYLHGFHTSNKYLLPALDTSFKHAIRLGTTSQGDYYEFGIFKGYSFWYAQNIAERYNLINMRFFGFDSFAGLPKPKGVDCTNDRIFYEKQYACSKQSVVRNLNSKRVDWKRTELIEGFFQESLNDHTRAKYQMNKIAIALIDCDLYSSTKQVLEFICCMLINGSVLIFDDWNCFNSDNELGQRRAFREFLEGNPSVMAGKLFSYASGGEVFILRIDTPPDEQKTMTATFVAFD